jgi:hypothetical protein
MKRRGPQGTCYLCGKVIWSYAVTGANGVRHSFCRPGPGPDGYGRYHVARKGKVQRGNQ